MSDSDKKEIPSENPRELFEQLYKKASSLGLQDEDLANMPSLKEIRPSRFWPGVISFTKKILMLTIGCLISLLLIWCVNWPIQNEQLVTLWFRLQSVPANEISLEPCLVSSSEKMSDIFRPPVDCSFCLDVKDFHRRKELTPEEFEEKYAYTGRPVIITDAMVNWTAPGKFSFEFFKEIYSEDSPALKNVESNCQFFPYRTNFHTLGEVFQMDDARAHMMDGSEPWYIGWSNCDYSAGNILRQHYSRPYFLPNSSESSKTDWIFMGSPGYGANLHIDHVFLPSWQAQVTGTKQWTLEPPPECYYVCESQITVTMQPGDVIVLDTNRWFHSTLNVGYDISITIGSEYD